MIIFLAAETARRPHRWSEPMDLLPYWGTLPPLLLSIRFGHYKYYYFLLVIRTYDFMLPFVCFLARVFVSQRGRFYVFIGLQ